MKRILASCLLLLGLALPAVADDHVVIVFDTSGSMGDYMRSAGQSRLDVAKAALVNVLTKLPPTTQVGILTFNGWIYDIQKVDQERLRQAVMNVDAGGGTPLYEFIAQGATKLLEVRKSNNNAGSYKLLVVTDGEATDSGLNDDSSFADGTPKMGVLKDVLSRGIIVDSIGLDMSDDHSLKTLINGKYMRGDDPGTLTQALQKAVAEVGFGPNQDVSDEAFREIQGLPEGFVVSIIEGLTTFQNHPIGEKPYVKVVQNGVVVEVPQPGGSAPAGGGGGLLTFVLIVIGIVVVIFAIGLLKVMMEGCR